MRMLGIARLCIALWTGAVLCVMFAVAPAVFGGIPEAQREAVPPGEILGPVFRAVDLFGIGATVLYLLTLAPARIPGKRWRALVVAGMGAAAAVDTFVLAPIIRNEGGSSAAHGISMALWTVVAVAGLAVGALDLRARHAGHGAT